MQSFQHIACVRLVGMSLRSRWDLVGVVLSLGLIGRVFIRVGVVRGVGVSCRLWHGGVPFSVRVRVGYFTPPYANVGRFSGPSHISAPSVCSGALIRPRIVISRMHFRSRKGL